MTKGTVIVGGSACWSALLILSCNVYQSNAFSSPKRAVIVGSRRGTNQKYGKRPRLRNTALRSSSDVKDNELQEGDLFGVGEKTIGMRDLIQTAEYEIYNSTTVPEADHSRPAMDIALDVDSSMEPAEEMTPKEAATNVTSEAPTLRPKAVLKFIAPTLALWIAPPVMSLIDTSVVGRYCGPTDLAALSPGCTLIDSSSYLFFFIATAATNLVASAIAEGNDSKAERTISEALFLALCSGTFLGGLVLLAGGPILMRIAGEASASVVPSALSYAWVRAFGQPFVIMASVARAAALAEKDTRGPLVSIGIAFILNVIGTLTLVTKTSLGITGAAVGTLCADIVATSFLMGRIRSKRKKSGETATPLLVVPTIESFQRFVKYAAPIFFTILGKSVVYNGIAISVGRMGSVALAAHQVLLRSFFFWCPVGDSVGMTSQVFLPGILARERKTGVPQRGAKRLLFGTGVLAGLAASVLAYLLPSRGAALFTRDATVAVALKRTAPVLGLSISMHAVALTCEGMLLAQRDLKFLSKSYIITTVATGALLLSPFRPATLGGSWWILALFQGSRSIQFALRNVFISRKRELKLA